MGLEFSHVKKTKERVLTEAAKHEPTLSEELKEIKTFQQLKWLVEKKRALASAAEPAMRGDDGEAIDVDQLIEEIDQIDFEEENGDPKEFTSTRQSSLLMRKVLEMRSVRAELNNAYAREWPAKLLTRPFSVHAIDRRAVRSLPPPTDTVPIIIAPGFSVGPRAVRRNAVSLAELGRSAMAYAVPTRTDEFDHDAEFPPGTPTYSKVHATALMRVMDAGQNDIYKEKTQFDVIGYSFGAVSTLVAAAADPSRFRNVILINPAGLSYQKAPDAWQYLKRYIKVASSAGKHREQVLSEIGEKPRRLSDRIWTPGKIRRALGSFGDLPDLSYNKAGALHEEFSAEMNEIAARGGLPEALRIADAISWADMVPLIERLETAGVKIRILPGEDDPLFDVNDIEKTGAATSTEVYPIAGAHAQLGFHPGAIAELCIDTLNEMKERRS